MLLHNIKVACKRKGVTLRQMETDLDLGTKTTSYWNKGIPAADKLLKVAKYLNTTVEALLEEEG